MKIVILRAELNEEKLFQHNTNGLFANPLKARQHSTKRLLELERYLADFSCERLQADDPLELEVVLAVC